MNFTLSAKDLKPSLVLKVFLLGEEGVGKRTFCRSLGMDSFDSNTKLTIGLDFFTCDYSYGLKEAHNFIRFSFWVYEPSSPFKKMLRYYLVGSSAILIMFDCSEYNTLLKIDDWMEKVNKCHHTEPLKILLGNKVDLVSETEKLSSIAKKFVEKYQLDNYFEISAKNSNNILNPIELMVEHYLPKFGFKP